MIKRSILTLTMSALIALADTQSHSVEPIIVGDGSIKVAIYWFNVQPKSVFPRKINNSILEAEAGSLGHTATFIVPNGVNSNGSLTVVRGTAHTSKMVVSYRYAIEQWNQQAHKFVPYADLVFTRAKGVWTILPSPLNALVLSPHVTEVPLTSVDWINHRKTTYEYVHGESRLRLGAVTIITSQGSTQLKLGTGCSAFRIESDEHSGNPLPPLEHPCPATTANPNQVLRSFVLANRIKAVDVSQLIAGDIK